jgi:hypothetical protein
VQAAERPEEQPRPDEENEREGDLSDDDRAPQTIAPGRADMVKTAPFLQSVGESPSRGAKGGARPS